MRAPGEAARSCIDLLMIAKYSERIGDHAVNIAEWVEYSLTGTQARAGVLRRAARPAPPKAECKYL
ncbi:MAG: PhoU domain-containing protein [Lawsonibacter sp.]